MKKLWSAEEMLDGQLQRVNVPAKARTVKKRPEEDPGYPSSPPPSPPQLSQGTKVNNWVTRMSILMQNHFGGTDDSGVLSIWPHWGMGWG